MSALISQIARRTGESCRTVKQRGFQVMRPDQTDDADGTVLLIDCPCCGKATFLAENVDELPELGECDNCDSLFDYRDDEVYPLDGQPSLVEQQVPNVPYGLIA